MNDRRFYKDPNFHHPLEGVVLESFAKIKVHDRVTLAGVLAGGNGFQGPRATTGWKSYLVVAEDVLGVMHDCGRLVKDKYGWYSLP
jgi:hypothetical protein